MLLETPITLLQEPIMSKALEQELPIEESESIDMPSTRVLAIASHVGSARSSQTWLYEGKYRTKILPQVVHGYVGNTVATFVMQYASYFPCCIRIASH